MFAAARDVSRLMASQRETAEEHAAAMDLLAELEKFHRLVIVREVKMVELKRTIADLSRGFDDDDRGGRSECQTSERFLAARSHRLFNA